MASLVHGAYEVTMGKTVLYALNGQPLLWYEDAPEPYRRSEIGFQPPHAREKHDPNRPPPSYEPVQASCHCECDEDAEAITLDFESVTPAKP